MIEDKLLLIHLISNAIMFGITWVVQLVHYPMIHMLDEEKFFEYQRAHVIPTTIITFPTMVTEWATAFLLVLYVSSGVNYLLLGLSTLLWISTMTLQVPTHRKLAKEYTEEMTDKLINTNWIRTAIWSFKLIFTAYLFL